MTMNPPSLPEKPGVYLLKDAAGTVLYVGKATNLRNRVRFYFSPPVKLGPKLSRMMEQVEHVDFIVADSEQESLLLECNLIKRYRPHYNVRLKDDKSFPYLKIDFKEQWPRLSITRRVTRDGRYFGPFASAWSVRQTLALLQRIFPLRSCSRMPPAGSRACLDYHIHRCVGPCIEAVTKEEYDAMIRQIILFLEGRQERVVKDLKSRMVDAAGKLQFEKAGYLRDQIQAVESVIEGQKIAAVVKGDQDVIAFALDKDLAYVEVFFVRGGKLTGREHFLLEGVRDESPEDITASFIEQFYASATSIPPAVLVEQNPTDRAALERWLTGKRGKKVTLRAPLKGEKAKLVRKVAENARQGMEQFRKKQLSSDEALAMALAELKERLRLDRPPERIECYDISNIQGAAAVGSMVVFEKGLPKPAHYRRFRIREVGGIDDYAMLQEVLRRRFGRAQSALEAGSAGVPQTTPTGHCEAPLGPKQSVSQPPGEDGEKGKAWGILPNLVLIDGGKGQLNAALEVVRELGVDVQVASVAKEKEEIFRPEQPEPVILPPTSPALYLIQRIRDEAHRFAIGYHRKLRAKESVISVLDGLPGLGPKRKRALLRHFGSVSGIKEATAEDIARVAGMSLATARKIKNELDAA